MDLGKVKSQVCILADSGELLHRRIPTERERLMEFFGNRPKARILVEASTETEWVARCLEEAGHEVIVGDPNYAPMYSQRSKVVANAAASAEPLPQVIDGIGAPRLIRTADLRFRKPLLYPAELWARG